MDTRRQFQAISNSNWNGDGQPRKQSLQAGLETAAVPPPKSEGLVHKWLELVRLNLVGRGLRYAGLWTSDLVFRLVAGASPLRFSRILPGLHVGGQYLAHGWDLLAERGVTAVINMRIEFDDRQAGIAPARYLHLPTVDNTAPSISHLRRGVEFIRREVAEGGSVYVHCEAGVGRAPTMAAAYLSAEGMASDTAWHFLRRHRPFIRPTSVQVTQVRRFESIAPGFGD